MAFICENAAFSTNIPKFQICISRPRAEKISIWMEIDTSNSSFMAGQSSD